MRKLKLFSMLLLLLIGVGQMLATDVEFIAGTETSSTTTLSKGNVTITVTSGTFSRTDNYRCYANNTMTISSSAGNISNIAFTFSGSYTGGWETSYQPNAASWTSSSASGQARITKITVTIGGSAEPTLFPDHSQTSPNML